MLRPTLVYWLKEIIPSAYHAAKEKLGLGGVLIEFLVSLAAPIYILLRGGQVNTAREVIGIGVLTLGIWGGLFVLTVAAFVFGEPLHREMSLIERLDKWEGERVRAKLRIEPKKQSDGHAGLDVINNEEWDLKDCSGRIVSLRYKEQNSPEEIITDDINPNHLLLTWGGGSERGKKTIPRGGGTGLLNIARHTHNRLEFIMQGLAGEMIHHRTEQGIYRFEIRIDAEMQERPIEKEIVRGYLEFQRVYRRDSKEDEFFSSSGGLVATFEPPEHVDYYFTRFEIGLGDPPYKWARESEED